MTAFAWFDTTFCTRIVLTFSHFLWQGALISLIVVALSVVLRRSSARLRYLCFLASLLLMTLCPVVTFCVIQPALVPDDRSVALESQAPLPVSGEIEVTRTPTDSTSVPLELAPMKTDSRPVERSISEPPALAQADNSPGNGDAQIAGGWQLAVPFLTAIYLLGVIILFGRLAIGLHGGRRLRRHSQLVEDPELVSAIACIAKLLGMRITPTVLYCKQVAVPTVVGVFRPAVLLPLSLSTGLSHQQVEAVLTHELAHIRRYDHLVNLLQRVVEALLFFHPAVWWVSQRIRVERENCCDDIVVGLGAEPLQYAASLLEVASQGQQGRRSWQLETVTALHAAKSDSRLGQRVRRLVSGSSGETLRLTRGSVMGLLFAICLMVTLWQVAAVQTVADTNANAATPKSELKPPDEQERSSSAALNYPLRGESPQERVKKHKPAWGATKSDLQLGVSRLVQRTKFRAGERVPFEFYIRNTGKRTLRVERESYYDGRPVVRDDDGKEAHVRVPNVRFLTPVFTETLKPNDVIVLRSGLCTTASPDTPMRHPLLQDVKQRITLPGKYRLTQPATVRITAIDGNAVNEGRIFLTSGAVEFEIVAANEKQGKVSIVSTASRQSEVEQLLKNIRENDAKFDNVALDYLKTEQKHIRMSPRLIKRLESERPKDFFKERLLRLVWHAQCVTRGNDFVHTMQYDPMMSQPDRYVSFDSYYRGGVLDGTVHELHFIDSKGRDRMRESQKRTSRFDGWHDFKMQIEFVHGIGYGKRIQNIDTIKKVGDRIALTGTLRLWEEDNSAFTMELDTDLIVRRAAIKCGEGETFNIMTEGIVDQEGLRLAKTGTFRCSGQIRGIPQTSFQTQVREIRRNITEAEFAELTRFDLDKLPKIERKQEQPEPSSVPRDRLDARESEQTEDIVTSHLKAPDNGDLRTHVVEIAKNSQVITR